MYICSLLMKNMIQSVQRTFQILEYIAANGNFIRVNDVAKALELEKTTVYGFIKSLKELGYLEQDEMSPRYRITSKLECLYAPPFSLIELKQELRPILEKITAATLESSYLAIQMGYYYRHELKCEPNRAVKITLNMGRDYEMNTTAIGKAFLAYSEHLQRNLFDSQNDQSALTAEVANIKQIGYALDIGAYDPDLNCVAMPIFFKNKVIAVLCVSGPSYRFKREQFIETLKVMNILLGEQGKYTTQVKL
ncbi:IclR family transcriptional regulator [Pedobacter hiemivivus]|uniref:IclR family transcriptional regulator n=2 Tax=Pedobacter hiemivivus TaxID=2530454 RepID=A0A4R0N5T3_9SPHI|nr:IclR family transcriptional regulator [Pedobacter hiemivivus]